MRTSFIRYLVFSTLCQFLVAGCSAADPSSQQAAAAASSKATNDEASAKQAFAPLGSPTKTVAAALDKPKVAPLGKPNMAVAKPKFALKLGSAPGAGANAPNRVAEVKRLIDGFHGIALRYGDNLVRAKTPEEKEALANRAPSARALRPFARLLASIIAADPSDEPALDALLFLSKYVGVAEIDATLAALPGETEDGPTVKLDPMALLVEHHADNTKVSEVLRTLPQGDATDAFLFALFNKTLSPKVRAAAGIPLVSSLMRNDRQDEAEKIAVEMHRDRYLAGVPLTSRPTGPTAKSWAWGKLIEIRSLGIGQVLPDVSGNKLDGSIGHISDYRGKVIVLDVWATWCGPCVAMIPHEVEMSERLKDKPFKILSVSCDKDQATLEKFLEDTPMPWDHWWVGQDSELYKNLNVGLLPTVYVLDDKGVIRHKNIKGEELEAAVNALLEEIDQPGG